MHHIFNISYAFFHSTFYSKVSYPFEADLNDLHSDLIDEADPDAEFNDFLPSYFDAFQHFETDIYEDSPDFVEYQLDLEPDLDSAFDWDMETYESKFATNLDIVIFFDQMFYNPIWGPYVFPPFNFILFDLLNEWWPYELGVFEQEAEYFVFLLTLDREADLKESADIESCFLEYRPLAYESFVERFWRHNNFMVFDKFQFESTLLRNSYFSFTFWYVGPFDYYALFNKEFNFFVDSVYSFFPKFDLYIGLERFEKEFKDFLIYNDYFEIYASIREFYFYINNYFSYNDLSSKFFTSFSFDNNFFFHNNTCSNLSLYYNVIFDSNNFCSVDNFNAIPVLTPFVLCESEYFFNYFGISQGSRFGSVFEIFLFSSNEYSKSYFSEQLTISDFDEVIDLTFSSMVIAVMIFYTNIYASYFGNIYRMNRENFFFEEDFPPFIDCWTVYYPNWKVEDCDDLLYLEEEEEPYLKELLHKFLDSFFGLPEHQAGNKSFKPLRYFPSRGCSEEMLVRKSYYRPDYELVQFDGVEPEFEVFINFMYDPYTCFFESELYTPCGKGPLWTKWILECYDMVEEVL